MKLKNLFILLSLSLAITGCANGNGLEEKADSKTGDLLVEEVSEEKPLVYASFFPIYNLTKQIGKDKVEVKSFANLTSESHGFEPSAKQMADLSEASLIFINGAGMEEWVDAVDSSIDIEIVDTSKDLDLIDASGQAHEDHEAHEGHEGHNHGAFDPHTWLDPINGKDQAKVIAEKLADLDPSNKDYYLANYEKIAGDLEEINQEFEEKFKTLTNKKFIVPHEAFAYLEKRYGLEQVPLTSLTSTGEADALALKQVADLALKEDINVIFYEKGGSDKLAKTLADEISGQTSELSTIEFLSEEELEKELSYQELVRENLKAIYDSLAE
ncbi:MAG: zinc ABC transporter substrate-binding protein [Anaerococcus sp.]|nr:zinc ABC transporter substrate-binding protein [Anaerococcus sp.]